MAVVALATHCTRATPPVKLNLTGENARVDRASGTRLANIRGDIDAIACGLQEHFHCGSILGWDGNAQVGDDIGGWK